MVFSGKACQPHNCRDKFTESRHKPLVAQSYVSVGVIFRSMWNGMVEVLVRLRILSLVGLLIYLFVGILGLVAPTTTDNPVFREGLDAIKTVLILPLEIAIYRLLILGEGTPGYNLAILNPRFQRLLGWTLGLWALSTLPPYLTGLSRRPRRKCNRDHGISGGRHRTPGADRHSFSGDRG